MVLTITRPYWNDLEAIGALVGGYFQRSEDLRDKELDAQGFINMMSAALDDEEEASFFIRTIVDEDGNIRGGFAGYLSEHWDIKYKVADDLCFYVDKESGIAGVRKLIDIIGLYERWADSVGADTIRLSGFTRESRKLAKLCGYTSACSYVKGG